MGIYGSKQSVVFPAFAQKLQRLDGKVVAITGCTSGTGFVAAKLSAEKGASVVMLNRASVRSTATLELIRKAAPEANVVSIACDLQDFASVKQAAAEVKDAFPKLDVLCNNAGIMAFPDQATKDGYDVQMQTNHLSHFLLTRELLPLLEAGGGASGGGAAASSHRRDARIVNHSSLVARYPLEP